MNKKDREKRNAEIVSMRKNGASMSEIAEHCGLTQSGVHSVCKRYGVAGVRSNRRATVQEYRNQYTTGAFDREANAIRYINERTPEFEYAGNFTGLDGYVDLKCKTCGTVMRKSFVTVRHGCATCKVCAKHKAEENEQKRRKEAERRAEERKRNTLLKRKYKQITFKACPVCNSLFVGSKTYCSEHCRLQNKYNMKDGYRHKFPLEEVYKRDNGICYLCGKLCDWNDYEERNGAIVYGNNYPSRDHVVPKSKGGTNDWENIRLAHRVCNSLKADSPLVKKIV